LAIGAAATPAVAESTAESGAAPSKPAPPAEALLVLPGGGDRRLGVVDFATSRSNLSIEQLSADVLPGEAPRRPSLSVRFGLESPRQWLRGIGVEASECNGILRPPARRPGDADGGSVELGARVALRCKF
jgi:hypothetical protein